MPNDKDGGQHLNSLQQLNRTEDRSIDEREQIVSFLRFIMRKAEQEQDKKLIRSIKNDIEDGKYRRECYQR